MTLTQQIITVAMVVLGTAVTRFLPFLVFPAYAEIYPLSGQGPALCGVRTSGYLQSEGRQYCNRQPRDPGADLYPPCCCAACVEAADASFHCRWDCVLYAARSAGVLIC